MVSQPFPGRSSHAVAPLGLFGGRFEWPVLPVPLASLIGRESERAAIGGLLRAPALRLVTLAGPGGVGMTRLALRLANDLAADASVFAGVALVELASIRDVDHVVPANAHPPLRFPLTPRQAEILPLLADGLTDREIAATLFLSPRTVAHHVAGLAARLGVRARGDRRRGPRRRPALPIALIVRR